jgi:two-component sensor histidine kinase
MTGSKKPPGAEKSENLKAIHHRVRNNLQIISSLLGLESRRVDDARAREAFLEMRNRVHSIATIHDVLEQSPSATLVDLLTCARQMLPDILKFSGAAGKIVPDVSGENITLEFDRAAPWGLLLNELVSGVCKRARSAAATVRLSVSLSRDAERIVMTVADTAPELPEDFEGLATQPMGLVKSLALQLRAELKVAAGRVTVTIPDGAD